MSRDARIYARARDAYENMLRERQLLLDSRTEEIARKNPRIDEILSQMQLSGLKAVRAAMDCPPDEVDKRIKEIADENLALQGERAELLTSLGYPADYLTRDAFCHECDDAGELDGHFCKCFLPYYARETAAEIERTVGYSLPDLNVTEKQVSGEAALKVLSECRRYADTVEVSRKGLLLEAASGFGKTYLALGIAREVISRGMTVLYVSAPDYFRFQEEDRYRHSDEARLELDRFQNCDMLILDDLGMEVPSQNNASFLISLLTSRIAAKRPTVICTQLRGDGLRTHYTPSIIMRLAYDFEHIDIPNPELQRAAYRIR